MTIERLSKQVRALEKQEERLAGEREKLEGQLATAIAAKLGIGIGSIIRTVSTHGWGEKVHKVTRRYHVTKISYEDWGTSRESLRIWGRTVRKDGSLGETCSVWREWTVEP